MAIWIERLEISQQAVLMARTLRPSLRSHGSREMRAPDDRLREAIQTPSFRDGPQDQTSDAQLRIGESRDSGFDASHRPGMTESGLLCRSRAPQCRNAAACRFKHSPK